MMLEFHSVMKELNNFRGYITSRYKELPWIESIALRQIYFKSLESDKSETTVSALINHMKISKSAVSQMLSSLEKKGFIERHISETDRRHIDLKLTDKGLAILKEYKKSTFDFLNCLSEKMGEADMAELLDLLKKLSSSINEIKSEETR